VSGTDRHATPARAVGGVHWADLDGLRALAIGLVLARHSLRPFISEDAYRPVATFGSLDLTSVLLNGWVGVDLFFVLSGFLIGRQAWKSADGLARFWFKRATRILPAYWTCLAAVALTLTLGQAWPRSGGHFLAHVVMLQDYTGSVFVPAFWSLGAEEKFYLLAPLLVWVFGRLPVRSWQAWGLLALWATPVAARAWASRGLVEPITYEAYFPLFRSPFHLTFESLVLGFAIAWASLQRGRSAGLSRPVREALFWTGAVVACAGMFPAPILREIGTGTIVLAPAIVGLSCGAMVLAAVSGRGTYSRCLGWSGWRPVATASYTLYLTHMMVLPVASALAAAYPLAVQSSSTGRWLAFLPWYVTLSVASAYLLHRYVERPVLRWRDRVLSGDDAWRPSVLTPRPASLRSIQE
jgi:peptidoglycan/LPS O-acetylase OafA/YrhL